MKRHLNKEYKSPIATAVRVCSVSCMKVYLVYLVYAVQYSILYETVCSAVYAVQYSKLYESVCSVVYAVQCVSVVV
jgi:hypothetical protein